MASFEVNLQAPGGAGANVVAPVKPHVTDVSAITNILDGFAKGMANKRKEEEAAFNQGILNDYVRANTSINDALEQGAISPEEAAARGRAVFNKFAANNPHLVEDFNKTKKAFKESSSLGEAIEEEQAQQELHRQMKRDATNAGYVFPRGMPPEFEAKQLQLFQEARAADVQFQRLRDRAQEARAQSGEEREATNYQLRRQTEQGLGRLATSQFEVASEFARGIAQRASTGEDPAVLIQDTNQFFSNIEVSIAQISVANPELGNAYRNVFNNLKQNAEEGISGKGRTEALNNKLQETKNRLQLIALGNPRNQGLYVTSALFGPEVIVNSVAANEAADIIIRSADANALNRLPEVPIDVFTDPEKKEAYFSMLKQMSKSADGGKNSNPVQAAQELVTANTVLLNSIGNQKIANLDPKQLQSAAEYVASPEFARVMEKAGPEFAEAARNAREVMAISYEQNVQRGVEQKLEQEFDFGGTRGKLKVADIIDIEFTGTGINFRPVNMPGISPFARQNVAQATRELQAQGVDPRQFDRFDQETRAAKNAVNQLIRMGAHLEGHKDYGRYFEANKHILFPNYYPDPEKLKVGQVVTGKDGKKYKYLGGNYNNIERSYQVVNDNGGE